MTSRTKPVRHQKICRTSIKSGQSYQQGGNPNPANTGRIGTQYLVENKNAPEGALLLKNWRSGRGSNPRPPA